MPRILPVLGLALALRCGAFAQTPTPAPALTLTLQEAMERAKANSQQLLSADIAARLAREDKVQAKAALLPSVNWENGFAYTQPNGTDTGVFVVNNGPRVYTNMANVHGDVYAPGKRADYQMAIAAEAIARAKVEIAARGLTAVVVQNFYAMAVAEVVEGRGLGEGNAAGTTRPGHSAGVSAISALDRVRRVAQKDRDVRFTALLHHADVDRLRAAYWALEPKAAPGVDGVTWEDYGQGLEANLRDLHGRVHRGSYRPRPSRRVYIRQPGRGGGLRQH